MPNLKVVCITTFYSWDKAYSLVNVVEQQLEMLVKYGYKPSLAVLSTFKDDEKVPKGVEIKRFLPPVKLADYSNNQQLQPDFKEQVEEIKKSLEENLQGFDIAFTHDWIFQGWFLVYNVAMREAKLNCKWLHWVHSAPSPRPEGLKYPYDCRYKTMPNSKLIYMNNYDTLRLAEMYGGNLDDVRVVYNPMDLRNFFDNSHPLTKVLIDKYKLLEADIIDVYPVSSTRFSGKQVNKVIKLMGKIKKHGKSVRFICPNAHANGDNEKKEIENLIHFGIEQGLTRQEMIFTSLEDKQYELGVPNEIVKNLFMLSNLFIFPTLSENCPLILLEAAASKCLLVLNESFPPLRDFFRENALYFKFGSLLEQVNYKDEELWYSDVAKIIIGELNKNKSLNAFNRLKQDFNIDYIMKQQLEPIMYELYGRQNN